MSGVMLAWGVLAALVARERLGVGQKVDVSILGSMALLQGLALSARLMLGAAAPRVRRAESVNPLWNHYRCLDGHWIVLAMPRESGTGASFVGVWGIRSWRLNGRECFRESQPLKPSPRST
jgi:crotonobetainyl-CoA:carnitine CoA-transferase CaiB-like acyl-CoA transferase